MVLPPRTPSAQGRSLRQQSMLLTEEQKSRIVEKMSGLHVVKGTELEDKFVAKLQGLEESEDDEEEVKKEIARPNRQTHRKPGVGPAQAGLLGRSEGSFMAPEAFYGCPLGSRVALKQYSDRLPTASEEKIPRDVQEALIMQDLLHVMAGLSGQYIAISEEEEDGQFEISSLINPSIASLASSLLPIAADYMAIQRFIQDQSALSSGCVSQALCAELRAVLKEHDSLLARIEHALKSDPSFTLHSMRFHLQGAARIMLLLKEISVTIQTANLLGAEEESDVESESDDGLDDKVKQLMREADGRPNKKALGPLKGSDILKVISDLVTLHGGDELSRSTLLRLLTAAAQPYIRILLEWISSGRLHDPYNEFFIMESAPVQDGPQDYTDDYWDRRYMVREEQLLSPTISEAEDPLVKIAHKVGRGSTPAFLQGNRDKIFLAGKFLNVIKECGVESMDAGVEDAPDFRTLQRAETIQLNDPKLTEAIDAAYTHANQTLLDLLLKSQHLMPRLRSIKHYFFMDQADSYTHFLDIAGHELSKKSKHISLTKVQSLLDIALRNPASVTSADPYKDDVRVSMASAGLVDWLLKVITVNGSVLTDGDREIEELSKDDKKQLTGYDALALDFDVKFPISLVISRRILLRYQLLFRHLFQLKHIGQLLESVWLEHFKTALWRKKTGHPGLEKWKSRVFALRLKMLVFVQQMTFYATSEVIEPNWRLFEKKVTKVKTVDHLMKDLLDFLDDSLKACMLTNAKLLRLLSKLLTTCTLFANYTSHFSKSLQSALTALADANGDSSQVSIETSAHLLQKFENNWKHHQAILVECLEYYSSTETLALTALSTRLDDRKRGLVNDVG